jgi:hypothetical protein
MGKLVTLGQGKKDSRSHTRATGAASLFRPAEGTPFGAVKPAQAIVATVIALACLCAAVLHFRNMGGDDELNRSQAQIQVNHKRLALAGLSDRRGGTSEGNRLETNR